MHRIKGRGLVELVSSVLNWQLWKGAGHFPNTLEVLDQSQHTDPADQSEHRVLYWRRGFIETGSKQSVTDRLGREEPGMTKGIAVFVTLNNSEIVSVSLDINLELRDINTKLQEIQ